MSRSVRLGMALGLAILATSSSIGCTSVARVGAFTDDAFFPTRDHYRVAYLDEVSAVMGAEWSLENFRVTAGGVGPAKWTRDFTRSLAFDNDDDGRLDAPIVIERNDLRFTHRIDGTVLWAQTTPISRRRADLALDVIAHDFVDRVGGTSYFEVDWTTDEVVARRFATTIRSEGPITVDEVPGHWITFDLISLDQRELDPTHAGERVTVVILHPSARWHRAPRAYDPSAVDGLPMLVTFGYASRAEYHDAHREEFESFLRRVDFHETE